jgi:hypothetical protein
MGVPLGAAGLQVMVPVAPSKSPAGGFNSTRVNHKELSKPEVLNTSALCGTQCRPLCHIVRHCSDSTAVQLHLQQSCARNQLHTCAQTPSLKADMLFISRGLLISKGCSMSLELAGWQLAVTA